MAKNADPVTAPDDYMETLERVKEQYRQYVEVSELYSLPTGSGESVDYAPPSADRPLTSNMIQTESD